VSTTGKNLLPLVVDRRRRQAIAMAAQHWTAREIACELGVHMRTVERYKAAGKIGPGRHEPRPGKLS
jgi:transposase